MMQRVEFRAMGCHIVAMVDRDSPYVAKHLKDVPIWFAAWEQQLSRFRPDSELVALNRSKGQPVHVSDVLWDVIELAIRAAHQSNGLVNPVVLESLERAGYQYSFEHQAAADLQNQANPCKANGQHTSPRQHIAQSPAYRLSFEHVEPHPSLQDWRNIQLDPVTHTVILPVGMRLDVGGFAKGWAAEQTGERLRSSGPALIDAGGDMTISGSMANGSRWPIGVANPFKPGEQLELLMVQKGGVATSGRDYRRWQHNGIWQHHIIDPRTGQPAQTDIMSVTIIAPSTVEAEIAAKMVFILGSQEGRKWLEARQTLAGLVICENGKIIRSRTLKEYTW